ncbi:TetR/AcrR family transcriptional regulator [Oceanibium sediminis]|uniref:TetR/AcrR family transcriptional regulator n=1 Tax=Oceanibium sediminis TaxID=2026339 RepID=UPI000DD323AD|nr:TetR/AcrR family transcriptional regulator [Oceanibium sediminis]
MARRSGSNGEATARDIRAAATRLFAAKGFAAVSMRQIAHEVGVQAGALYLYTPDKQSLLADMMIDHLEHLLSAWDAARSDDSDPVARLQGFVRFHIRYHLARVDEVFIAYMELRNLSPENFARVERLRRLYENVVEEILVDGAEKGVFRVTDPRIATLALIAMLTGIGTWYRADGRLSTERIEQIYIELALGSLGAALG